MVRWLLSGVLIFASCTQAVAQQNTMIWNPDWAHWAITFFGLAVAMRLALTAFDRRPVSVADVPTFPRYMTSRSQYRLGSWVFVIFACGFFLLLVREHRQVISTVSLLQASLPIPKGVLTAMEDESPPYLAVIIAMGAVYLYLLTKEAEWNVLLMMRDVIQRWISIPQLSGQIIAQIRYSLRVPEDAIADVIASSTGVLQQDFYKDPNTPDRIWAETCYMKWWLIQGQDAGEDATFFTEESFGFEKLLDEFQQTSLAMGQWKSGSTDLLIANLPQKIKELNNRFARLVACYLIYRNGSKKELCAEADKFGIEVSAAGSENPLRYWIVYAVALMVSVYVGVYASAISYDLFTGQGLRFDQDANRVLAWVMYTLSNFGLAIFVVLLLRFIMRALQLDLNRSHLIIYCWTLLIAFVVGPFGLTIAVQVFGQSKLASMPFGELYSYMLKWGLGPALVSVYISYYLDRQTYYDLPNIDHSYATFGWRLLNCLGFAAMVVFVLLPPLLSLQENKLNPIWSLDKLRFIATGATFSVALGLALAAQFALRKGTKEEPLTSP